MKEKEKRYGNIQRSEVRSERGEIILNSNDNFAIRGTQRLYTVVCVPQ